ncbi:acyltransferase family protein [Bradyrhizobium sp. ORS 86]|uniref:acyltransferase family protein n=1 Tax=Bradyrhizobium sp. ORS 86 TaxID=1685970 RepID=UPI00388F8B00
MEQDRLPGLQAGRAIAALSVVYFHSYIALRWFPTGAVHPFPPLAAGGFFGVDFFFAISGYVISVVTDRPRFSTVQFLIKRIFRLYPVVIIFSLLQLWLHRAAIVDVTVDHSWSRVLYGMSLLPDDGERYYAVTWTLEHEIIFYVLAAILVPLIGRTGLMLLLFVLTAIAYLVRPEIGKGHIFTMVHANFAVGILAYEYRNALQKLGTLGPILTAPLLYWASLYGYQLAIPAASLLALVGFVNLRGSGGAWRSVVLLGDASYSIYLSHWIILYLSNRLAFDIEASVPAEIWRFGTMVAVCVISIALWFGIERPINAIGHRLAGRYRHHAEDRQLSTA